MKTAKSAKTTKKKRRNANVGGCLKAGMGCTLLNFLNVQRNPQQTAVPAKT